MNTLLVAQKNKRIIDIYPYLLPINPWTGKQVSGYDYSYIIGDMELPRGYRPLFFDMCKRINGILQSEKKMKKFRIIGVRLANGKMVCVSNHVSQAVDLLVERYCHVSAGICSRCGKPACFQEAKSKLNYCEKCICKLSGGMARKISFSPFYEDGNGNTVDCTFEWIRALGLQTGESIWKKI